MPPKIGINGLNIGKEYIFKAMEPLGRSTLPKHHWHKYKGVDHPLYPMYILEQKDGQPPNPGPKTCIT